MKAVRSVLTEGRFQVSSQEATAALSTASAEMDNDVTSAVLKQFVKLYVTIRGFAFTTSCLELYKQAHKKTPEEGSTPQGTVSIRLGIIVMQMAIC